jgi:hypothetical protein
VVPDYAALADLKTTAQVITEALRLRPPSWSIFRQANLDSRLGGTRIERDDYLLLPQWTLHRDGRFFKAPETFDPSQWADRATSDTPAYFPSGAGPHACIGRQLVLTEARLVVTGVLAHFELETVVGGTDDVRPAGGAPAGRRGDGNAADGLMLAATQAGARRLSRSDTTVSSGAGTCRHVRDGHSRRSSNGVKTTSRRYDRRCVYMGRAHLPI